jgi:energy-converting hydrogenase Eha subunit A
VKLVLAVRAVITGLTIEAKVVLQVTPRAEPIEVSGYTAIVPTPVVWVVLTVTEVEPAAIIKNPCDALAQAAGEAIETH